jgi:acyl carrier protein
MRPDALRKLVLECLVEVAPEAEPQALDPARAFRDQLEIDSLDFLNFVLGLERRLGVRIPESDYPRLASLAGCLAYLAAQAGAGTDRRRRRV